MNAFLLSRKWIIIITLGTALIINAVPENWQQRLKNTYAAFPIIEGLAEAQNRQLSPVIGALNWQTGRLDGWIKRNPLLKPTITVRDGLNIETFEPEQQTLPVNQLMTTLFRVINGRANGTVEPRQLKNNVPFAVYVKGLYGEFIKAIIEDDTAKLNDIYNAVQKPKKNLKRHEYDAFVELVTKAFNPSAEDLELYTADTAQMLLSNFYMANVLKNSQIQTNEQFDQAISSYMQAFDPDYTAVVYTDNEILTGTQEPAESGLIRAFYLLSEEFLFAPHIAYTVIPIQTVFGHEKLTIEKKQVDYANCVETTLLNFFNALLFNPLTQTFDSSVLPEDAQTVREFYTKFNNPKTNDIPQMLLEWTKLLIKHADQNSGLAFAKKLSSGQAFELNGDFGNFLHAVQYLLGQSLTPIFVGKVEDTTQARSALMGDVILFNTTLQAIITSFNEKTKDRGYHMLEYQGDQNINEQNGLSFKLTRKFSTDTSHAGFTFTLYWGHDDSKLLPRSSGNSTYYKVTEDEYAQDPLTYGFIVTQTPENVRDFYGYRTHYNIIQNAIYPKETRAHLQKDLDSKAFSSYDALGLLKNQIIPASLKDNIATYTLERVIPVMPLLREQMNLLNAMTFLVDSSSAPYQKIIQTQQDISVNAAVEDRFYFICTYAAKATLYVLQNNALNPADNWEQQLKDILHSRPTDIDQAVAMRMAQAIKECHQDGKTIPEIIDAFIKHPVFDSELYYTMQIVAPDLSCRKHCALIYSHICAILTRNLIPLLTLEYAKDLDGADPLSLISSEKEEERPDAKIIEVTQREKIIRAYAANVRKAMKVYMYQQPTAEMLINRQLMRHYNLPSFPIFIKSISWLRNESSFAHHMPAIQRFMVDILTADHRSSDYRNLHNYMVEKFADANAQESLVTDFILGEIIDILYLENPAPGTRIGELHATYCTPYEMIRVSQELLAIIIEADYQEGIAWLVEQLEQPKTTQATLDAEQVRMILSPLEKRAAELSQEQRAS